MERSRQRRGQAPRGFAQRLKEARAEAGLTQAEAARGIGRPQQTLGGWEAGRAQPDLATLEALLKLYGCPPNSFFRYAPSPADGLPPEERELLGQYRGLDSHGRQAVRAILQIEHARAEQPGLERPRPEQPGPEQPRPEQPGLEQPGPEQSRLERPRPEQPRPEQSRPEQPGRVVLLPCYGLAVSAGTGEPWDSSGYRTRLELPAQRVPERAGYCVRVNGDSMEPAFRHGDIVFVEPLNGPLREGETGVFALNGEGYLKRLGSGRLLSLNPAYAPIPLTDSDDLRCQGRVLGKL